MVCEIDKRLREAGVGGIGDDTRRSWILRLVVAYLRYRPYFHPQPQEEPPATQYPEIKSLVLDSVLFGEKKS